MAEQVIHRHLWLACGVWPQSETERRFGGHRFEVCWPLETICPQSIPAHGRVLRVNDCGLLFQTAARLESGQDVSLRLHLPSVGVIECRARILRSRVWPGLTPFYGAEFGAFYGDGRRTLQKMLFTLREHAWQLEDGRRAARNEEAVPDSTTVLCSQADLGTVTSTKRR